ncbi:unnamed protein product, partial [Iphiclides podalirius]
MGAHVLPPAARGAPTIIWAGSLYMLTLIGAACVEPLQWPEVKSAIISSMVMAAVVPRRVGRLRGRGARVK